MNEKAGPSAGRGCRWQLGSVLIRRVSARVRPADRDVSDVDYLDAERPSSGWTAIFVMRVGQSKPDGLWVKTHV